MGHPNVNAKSKALPYTDHSGAITTGGTSQEVAAAIEGRSYLYFQNISDIDMWLNFGAAAVADQPSIKVAAGAAYEPRTAPTGAVNMIGATTGKKFVCKEA